MMNRLTVAALAASCLLAGCTTKFNDRNTHSHFVFPNSNIKMLGPVQAEVSRWSFFLPPAIDAEEVHELMESARSQVSGADLVMNYRTETVFTAYPLFINNIKITIEGTAAKMTVGKQKLIEDVDY